MDPVWHQPRLVDVPPALHRWVILDLRAQLSVDPWMGSVELARYSEDGAVEYPFAADIARGDAARIVLAGIRHFCGQLAVITGWPDLQSRSLSLSPPPSSRSRA